MSKQYDVCPKCGSDNLDYDNFEHEDSVWRNITCMDCFFSWLEIFEFAHNEDGDLNVLDDDGNIVEEP